MFPFNFTTLTIDSGLTIRGGNATIGQANADLILNADLFADVGGDSFLITATGWSGKRAKSFGSGRKDFSFKCIYARKTIPSSC